VRKPEIHFSFVWSPHSALTFTRQYSVVMPVAGSVTSYRSLSVMENLHLGAAAGGSTGSTMAACVCICSSGAAAGPPTSQVQGSVVVVVQGSGSQPPSSDSLWTVTPALDGRIDAQSPIRSMLMKATAMVRRALTVELVRGRAGASVLTLSISGSPQWWSVVVS